jgi:hypothetical protein
MSAGWSFGKVTLTGGYTIAIYRFKERLYGTLILKTLATILNQIKLKCMIRI